MVNDVSDLILNLKNLHTTELGVLRIKKNLSLSTDHVIDWCQNKIKSKEASFTRKGKNWYVTVGNVLITINASSYTVITAHKIESS